MPLACPQCAAAMNPVKAETTTGYCVLLDQCPRCGGIWCDRWELYPVTAAAAERIDPVDQQALHQPIPTADEQLQCPRCSARMFRLRDPSLPADSRIERCPNCDGMWLNRGELRSFKERGAPAAGVHAGPAANALMNEAGLDRLTQQTLDPKSWPTVSTLDQAFENNAPAEDDAEEAREALKSSAVWLVARTALRLLLHI